MRDREVPENSRRGLTCREGVHTVVLRVDSMDSLTTEVTTDGSTAGEEAFGTGDWAAMESEIREMSPFILVANDLVKVDMTADWRVEGRFHGPG